MVSGLVTRALGCGCDTVMRPRAELRVVADGTGDGDVARVAEDPIDGARLGLCEAALSLLPQAASTTHAASSNPTRTSTAPRPR